MTNAAPPRKPADKTSYTRRFLTLTILLLLAASTLVPGAMAQSGRLGTPSSACAEKCFNVQCTEFGTMKMENQRDIRGEPITMTITTTLHDTYERSGARWVMFSVRHVPEGSGGSPISLQLMDFTSAYGPVYITSIDHDFANEINIWVHVVDVPLDTPLKLDVSVGAGDRGAFRLEALAMPFDRGYEPIADSLGADQILYSFTVLGVNKETTGVSAGGGISGRGIPMTGPLVLGAALLACAAMLRRRSA